MKKTIILSSLLLAVVLFFATNADAQKNQGKKHGKQASSQMHKCCSNFVDANGDGKCDNFVDANGDGKCDSCKNANCTGSCDGKMGNGKHCSSDSSACNNHGKHGNCDNQGKHGKGKNCGHKCSDSTATPNPDGSLKMLGTEENSIASNVSTTPMPAGNEVKINFSLQQAGSVSIDIYDRTGAKVANVFNGNLGAQDHSISVNTSNYSNGTYFYRISVNGKQTTQKMLISK